MAKVSTNVVEKLSIYSDDSDDCAAMENDGQIIVLSSASSSDTETEDKRTDRRDEERLALDSISETITAARTCAPETVEAPAIDEVQESDETQHIYEAPAMDAASDPLLDELIPATTSTSSFTITMTTTAEIPITIDEETPSPKTPSNNHMGYGKKRHQSNSQYINKY